MLCEGDKIADERGVATITTVTCMRECGQSPQSALCIILLGALSVQEFLDVMDGETSDNYEYFRTLIIRGFLEARKHADRIILLVEMMLSGKR